jgi:hypothetical protein
LQKSRRVVNATRFEDFHRGNERLESVCNGMFPLIRHSSVNNEVHRGLQQVVGVCGFYSVNLRLFCGESGGKTQISVHNRGWLNKKKKKHLRGISLMKPTKFRQVGASGAKGTTVLARGEFQTLHLCTIKLL